MALLEDEKTDAIRHLEYPIVGLPQSGPQGQNFAQGDGGLRFMQPFGSLLYVLNQLSPNEEAKMAGKAYASISFNTPMTPLPGDFIQVTISGGSLPAPISASVTVPPQRLQTTQWNCQLIAAALQQAFTLQTAFQESGFYAVAPFGAQPWAQAKIPNPTLAIIAPSGSPGFNVSASFTGTIAPQIAANGNLVAPFLPSGSDCGGAVLFGFIPICNQLEANWLSTTNRLAASTANNVKLNSQELEQREQQFVMWVRKMARFIGLPLNPMVLDRGAPDRALW